MEKMSVARALRNAILSVEDTRENYDTDYSYLDTLETLHRLLFAAEQGEGKTT